MRERLTYFVRNLDWKFLLAMCAVVVMVGLAWRFV